MSTIRVVNLQHTDATVPNIVLESDGTSVFASGITISGATTLTVSGTAEFASGTAAAPKLTFIDDNDTGIYSPAANNLGITTNGTAALTIDSSQRVGIGTVLPKRHLHINGGNETTKIQITNQTTGSGNDGEGFQLGIATDGTANIEQRENADLVFATNNNERMRLDSSGRLLVGATSALETAAGRQLQVSDANGAFLVLGRNDTTVGDGPGLGGVHFYGNDTTNNDWTKLATIDCSSDGVQGPGDNPTRLVFSTTADNASSPTERLRIDSSGRVGVGTQSPSESLEVAGNGLKISGQTSGVTDEGITFDWDSGSNNGRIFSESAGSSNLLFYTTSSGTRGERMRIDSSGNVGIGTTPSGLLNLGYVLRLNGNTQTFLAFNNSTHTTQATGGFVIGNDGSAAYVIQRQNQPLLFLTNDLERMRIDSSGNVLIGKTSAGISNSGIEFDSTAQDAMFTTYAATPVYVNRLFNDGVLISLQGQSTEEGSINVNGTTVSLVGGHLSRWSQLPGGAERTEILRGSVLSNIDEMCEWGDEDNEQLNRMQVSTVEGDRNVSGVFQGWDDDDDTYTNDFYCAMTGDFIIRIAQGTTVARGDLLMSAGDGTAKPQDDDIIRSKTIAKVTSTHVSETYADGSYCVPCVLMAC